MIKNYFIQMLPEIRLLSKFIIQMKVAFSIVLITCLNVSAKVFSQQKLSLDVQNVKLQKVLQVIEKSSGYRFVYSPTEGPFNKTVSLKADKALISDILTNLLTGTNLTFFMDDSKLITIGTKNSLKRDITVSGLVTDTAGVGLPGVSVSVKGFSSLGASTDAQGKFTLAKVPDNATLVFTMVGFQTREIVASATINIVLMESANKLDEVVVQAFGKTTKRKSTSAISSIDMSNVAPIPVQSINDAVAGRLPGVIVTASSGAPGSKSGITVRGQSPIYVIDDVIRSANDFSNLNPNDIESYSILKDAGATAVYGNQGANGVVIVTTKRGSEGKASISYSYNQIFSQPAIFPKRVSSFEQLSQLNKLHLLEGRTQPISDVDLEKYRTGSDPLNFPNTDWQDLTMKRFAPEMRHDLSVTAGSKKLTYYAGLSHYNQGTILKTDNNYNKRTTYRLNTTSSFEKINLKVLAGIDGYIESNLQPVAGYRGVFSHIQNLGTRQLAQNEFGLPATTPDNPYRELASESGYVSKLDKILNTSLELEYSAHFLDGLKFKGRMQYASFNTVGKSWNYLAPGYLNGSTTPVYGPAPSLNVNQGQGNTTTLQGYVLYNKTFGDHAVDFTGIYIQDRSESSNVSGRKQNYQIIYDQLVAGPALDQSVSGGEGEGGNAGFLARINYSYKSKYTIELSGRRDGSYLFVPGSQWGSFGAVSGNYIISEEKFMQSLKDKHILDFLKLRGSVGLLGDRKGSDGNDIPAFQYISAYSIDAAGNVINNALVQGTSEPTVLPNSTYSWQTVSSRDLALEFATLNNRLSGTFDYFYTRRTGLVTGDPRFAQTLGIGLPRINFTEGGIRTEGFDFNINWASNWGDFTYKVGLNFTRQNSLTERSPNDDDATLKNPYTRLTNIAGGFLRTGYLSQGLYGSNSDLLTGARRIASVGAAAGDIRYLDLNGDGQLTGDDQRRIGSNTFPRTNYGITIDLGYKGFTFSAVLQGAGNRDRYLGDAVRGLSYSNLFAYEFQQDYWRPDNTNALFPRLVTDGSVNGNHNYGAASDFWLIQSKYVRLKYLQLGYDFKKGVLKKAPFQQMRLFASGTNLLSSSKSQKYFIDPESDPENYGYPIQRTIAFGLNVVF